ncbi:MAG: TIGR02466 family protein [Pseudomonadota bacterium]
MKKIQSWFPTQIYCAPLGGGVAALNRELLTDTAKIRAADAAGKRWSKTSYPGGYTSYGSLDQLHRMSSTFAELQKRIDRHVRAYSKAQQWNLRGRKLVMTDCWVNVMPKGCAHSFHLHPQSVISGTYYVHTPRGCPGLKFEDPRLSRLMAAPVRAAHISYPARAGEVILFESWLRHEVPANQASQERVSISFNYHLA